MNLGVSQLFPSPQSEESVNSDNGCIVEKRLMIELNLSRKETR